MSSVEHTDDKPVKLVQDLMPREFQVEFTDTYAFTLRGVRVLAEYYSHEKRWPGGHKNVHWWVALDNGKAIGWNENPARGWSFPVINWKHERCVG